MDTFDMTTLVSDGQVTYCAILIQAPSEEWLIEAVKALQLPFSCILPCGNEYSVASIADLPMVDLSCPCGNPNHWLVRYTIDPSLDTTEKGTPWKQTEPE